MRPNETMVQACMYYPLSLIPGVYIFQVKKGACGAKRELIQVLTQNLIHMQLPCIPFPPNTLVNNHNKLFSHPAALPARNFVNYMPAMHTLFPVRCMSIQGCFREALHLSYAIAYCQNLYQRLEYFSLLTGFMQELQRPTEDWKMQTMHEQWYQQIKQVLIIHTTEYLYKFKGIQVQINLPMQYSQLYSKCFRGGRNATK